MQKNFQGLIESEILERLQGTQMYSKRSSNQSVLDPLFPSFSNETLSLNEIIDQSECFFNSKNPSHIEKNLLEALQVQEFLSLGLSRSYPRMYRGLPRLYHRNTPTQSHIKKEFTHLACLKKQAVGKALFSLYGKFPAKGIVTLFTWIQDDDCVAAIEIARILRSRLPEVTIQFVALAEKKIASSLSFFEKSMIFSYENQCSLKTISDEAMVLLRNSDLILHLPTFYPHLEELVSALEEIGSNKPMPKVEFLGDYGFVESNWFHPKSERYSLGLHFLEKGILTRKACTSSWNDVKNEQLKRWRLSENHFYLAYLSSSMGGAIYLHSLLKSLESDEKGIDICTPDLDWLVQFIEKQNKGGKSILEWDLGVATIEIYFGDQIHSYQVAPLGKVVRILSPASITQSDFRALLALSGDWVAVRGSQSFSEAVSQGKPFFFDGREQNRYLIKDLVAIAENRVGAYPSTLACIRGMNQGLLYNVPLQEGEWVDEAHFQDLDEWTAIALSLGLALQDPDAVLGFKKLNQILGEEFSANSYLCHLVQRALCHRQYPEIEKVENEELTLFALNSKTFAQLALSIKSFLQGL